MLTYATLPEFKRFMSVNRGGQVAVSAGDAFGTEDNERVLAYLRRATDFISTITKREFYPWIQTRNYAAPWAYIDLSIRRLPRAHLKLDQDLLEVLEITSGDTEIESENFFLLEHNIYPKRVVVLSAGFWSGSSARYDQSSIDINAIWGFHNGQYGVPNTAWIDTLEVVPLGGITSSQTSITLSDIDGKDAQYLNRIAVGNMLRIGNEFIEVVDANTSTNVITVLRGVRGSTAAAHDAGVKIYRWKVVEPIVGATYQVAKTFMEKDISAGGRTAVSDISVDVEQVPMDAVATIRRYTRSILS